MGKFAIYALGKAEGTKYRQQCLGKPSKYYSAIPAYRQGFDESYRKRD